MKTKLRRVKNILTIVLVFVCGIVTILTVNADLFSETVSAAKNDEKTSDLEVVKKALLTGVRYCYLNGKIGPSEETVENFQIDINSIGDDFVAVPSGYSAIDDNGLSCYELMTGNIFGEGHYEGVFELMGKNYESFASNEEKVAFMEGMGWEVEEEKYSQVCVQAIFKEGVSNKLCQKEDGDLEIKEVTENGVDQNVVKFTLQYGETKVEVGIDLSSTDYGDINSYCSNHYYSNLGYDEIESCTGQFYVTLNKDNVNWVDLKDSLGQILGSDIMQGAVSYSAPGLGDYEELKETNEDSTDTEDTKYILMDADKAYRQALKYLSDGSYSTLSTLAFTKDEEISYLFNSLYEWFFYNFKDTTEDFWTCTSKLTRYDTEIKINPDGDVTEGCKIDTDKATNKKNMHGFTDTTVSLATGGTTTYRIFDADGHSSWTLKETIERINELVDAGAVISALETGNMNVKEEDENACSTAGGSLGWILCPIIQGLSSVTQSIYDGILTGFLEVKTKLFENDGYSYTAWEVFRDMANLILVFAMLAMILSQLTGFGISTYGVKKYLPRIVAVAILVNVSFFICQLAVDVSNIVGFSLNNFLDGIASQVRDNYSYRVSAGEASSSSSGVSWFSQFFGWTAILVILAVAGFLAYFMIFAVLFALLAAVVALVLMFILLGLRQAIVVIFVIISPVVVALYALPNTEKLAKQALTVFSKMLLMFPMAATLFGGASLASQIILSVTITDESDLGTFNGILMYLTALIVAVVPLFFLPKLVKSSFAAAGGAFRAIAAGGLLGAAAGAAQGKMRAAAGAGMQRLGATIGEKTGFSNWNNTRKAIQAQKIEQGNNRRAKDRVGKIQERLASGEPMSDRKRSRLQAQMGILGGQAAKYDQEQYDRALGSARISLAGKSNDDIVGSLRQMQGAGKLDSADAKAYAAVLTGRGAKGVEEFNKFAKGVADGGDANQAQAMANMYFSGDVAKNTANSVVGAALAAQFAEGKKGVGKNANGESIAGAEVTRRLQNASAQQWANMSDAEFKNNIRMMSDHVRQEFQTNANMRGSLTQAKFNALGVAAPSAGPSAPSDTPSGASETNAGSGTGGGSNRSGDDLGHVSGDQPHSRT